MTLMWVSRWRLRRGLTGGGPRGWILAFARMTVRYAGMTNASGGGVRATLRPAQDGGLAPGGMAGRWGFGTCREV